MRPADVLDAIAAGWDTDKAVAAYLGVACDRQNTWTLTNR